MNHSSIEKAPNSRNELFTYNKQLSKEPILNFIFRHINTVAFCDKTHNLFQFL